MRTSLSISSLLIFLVLACSVNLILGQDLGNIANEKPIKFSGSFLLNSGFYHSSGFNSSKKPFTYSAMGAPVITAFGIQIPVNFTYSEGSGKLNNPFAQFGINPYWKWVKVYAGWSNMNWSQGTLAGKTFLGGGVELNPGILRVGAMFGRLNPAIVQDSVKAGEPQYKRMGQAFKLGIGKTENYFDIIYLKGKDELNSIPAVNDYNNFAPQENAVFGIVNRNTFLKKRLVWLTDASASAFSRDLNSKVLNLDSVLPSGQKNFINKILVPRYSSSLSWMAHSNLSFKTKFLNLSGDYLLIQSDYRSMGADYISNDLQKFQLAEGFNSKNRKVQFMLSQSYQHDDLDKSKSAKTHRGNGLIGLNLIPSQKFGLALTYTASKLFQTNGLKILTDSSRLNQLNHNILVAPRLTVITPEKLHAFIFSALYATNKDFNPLTSPYSHSNVYNFNFVYSLSYNKKGFNVAPSLNYLINQVASIETINYSPAIVLSKTLFSEKLNCSLTTAYTFGYLNSTLLNTTLCIQPGISYTIGKMQSLKFSFAWMQNSNSGNISKETKGDIGYVFTF